jgi:hypothetical protein
LQVDARGFVGGIGGPEITIASEAHTCRDVVWWNKTYVSWVDVSLDNVENADIAGCLGECRGYHSILWL